MTQTSQKSATIVKIDENHAGQRLDNFLFSHMKGVPKTHVYRIVRKGEVRINKKRSKAQTRLESGDEIRIPPVRMSERKPGVPSVIVQDTLLDTIIFEDEHLLVMNKPAGWPVHGGSGNEFGIIEVVRAAKPNTPFIELAHRIDKDTSGCLVVARSRPALTGLHDMFRSHDGSVNKVYTTLLGGHWNQGKQTVDISLSSKFDEKNSRSIVANTDGKAAITRFSPTRVFAQASLMKATITTGRRHQIRAHAVHMGHPVAGDRKYGDFSFNNAMKKQYGLKRMFLHASRISFRHPVDNRELSFNTPLPDELKSVLHQMNHESL